MRTVLAVLAAASLASAARADTVVVNVLGHDFSTNPPTGTVQDAVINVGDTIRWNFTASFHSTTSVFGSAESWDSGLIFSIPHTYDHTFNTVGVFHYYCSIHGFDNLDGTAGGMAGTITVLPGGPTCDSVDFNRDDLFPDTQDITDFLALFAGSPCPTDPPVGNGCNDVDFNNDGLFPDTLDIEAFLSVFAGGPCL
jgi:plastocyanin